MMRAKRRKLLSSWGFSYSGVSSRQNGINEGDLSNSKLDEEGGRCVIIKAASLRQTKNGGGPSSRL